MNASESDSSSTSSEGDEPPAQALLRYMQWWSEDHYCAGWLVNLQTVMARADDPAFDWLVEQAGGWWWWPNDAEGVVFRPGSAAELKASSSVRPTS